MEFEKLVIGLLKSHLAIVLPLAIVALRLLAFKLADDMKEVYRNLLVLPQDFTYIAVSLILAGLSRNIPAFAAKYDSSTDADLAGALLLLGLVLLAILLIYLNRIVTIFLHSFHVACTQISKAKKQPSFNWGNAPSAIGGRLAWAVFYIVFVVCLLTLEFVLAIGALWTALERVGA